jgi:hypothetical protein
MPGEDIWVWSPTAISNGTVDTGIAWPEGQTRASVNNSARSMMAAIAKWRDESTGAITTGGSPNAQTFFSGNSYTTVPTGMLVRLKIGVGPNTGSTTLSMDSLPGVIIKSQYGSDLTGGELLPGTYAEFRKDATNWILLRGAVRVFLRVFTASDDYRPTPGMTHCIIEGVGGGGGGGFGYHSDGAYLAAITGGGGGAGGYSRKRATATEIGASQSVFIGGGGGGSSNGGDTVVGSLLIAKGGLLGGNNSVSGYNAYGGLGGAAGTGDFTSAGAQGQAGGYFLIGVASSPGVSIVLASGQGGNSIFGGGGAPTATSVGGMGVTDGGAAVGYGSGGAGGASSNPGFAGNGGAGKAGVVLITEFVS